jgi:uncharacterized protein
MTVQDSLQTPFKESKVMPIIFHLPLYEIFELGLLGIVSGFLAGLLGIGGGAVIVPIITMILDFNGVDTGLSVKMAIATSMATIMFTSLSSVRAHHRSGNVKWGLVGRLAPGIVLGSFIGSLGIFSYIKGNALSVIFALFIGFSATQMFLDKKPPPQRQFPQGLGQWISGGVIGMISGLVGAGGAFISVPFMLFCNVPMLNAVATSSALGFPIALANSLGYTISGWDTPNLPEFSFGYIWLPALIFISCFSVITAPHGARAAQKLPVKKLKRFFACFLYLMALYMISKIFRDA